MHDDCAGALYAAVGNPAMSRQVANLWRISSRYVGTGDQA